MGSAPQLRSSPPQAGSNAHHLFSVDGKTFQLVREGTRGIIYAIKESRGILHTLEDLPWEEAAEQFEKLRVQHGAISTEAVDVEAKVGLVPLLPLSPPGVETCYPPQGYLARLYFTPDLQPKIRTHQHVFSPGAGTALKLSALSAQPEPLFYEIFYRPLTESHPEEIQFITPLPTGSQGLSQAPVGAVPEHGWGLLAPAAGESNAVVTREGGPPIVSLKVGKPVGALVPLLAFDEFTRDWVKVGETPRTDALCKMSEQGELALLSYRAFNPRNQAMRGISILGAVPHTAVPEETHPLAAAYWKLAPLRATAHSPKPPAAVDKPPTPDGEDNDLSNLF